MSEGIKRINIKEFREEGFLQEANRLFFHPLGLALEIMINDETGEEFLGGVWDYREDGEGIYFHESEQLSVEKAEFVENIRKSKANARTKILGNEIQPIK